VRQVLAQVCVPSRLNSCALYCAGVCRRAALEEAALPLMLEAMWAANVLDIQTTLRKVRSCQV
jgi:hypothetical protein